MATQGIQPGECLSTRPRPTSSVFIVADKAARSLAVNGIDVTFEVGWPLEELGTLGALERGWRVGDCVADKSPLGGKDSVAVGAG